MEKPIRIAHIVGKLAAGGVEMVVYNYYRNIDHSKIQFDFIADDDSTAKIPQDILDMGARIFYVPRYQNVFSYMKALYRLFKKNKYEIVHSNMNTLSVFSLFIAWLAGVKTRICHNHSTAAKGEGKKNLFKYILRPLAKVFATDYFACSELAGRWLFGDKCYNSGKVTLIRNAVDINRFSYDIETRNKIRKELAVEDKFVIGHVGRFMFQKNHGFLIDIFNQVYKQNQNAVLLLVGDGELKEQIQQKVHLLGLDKAVKFLGIRNDVNKLYQCMDVFLFPSHYEGLGLVAVESQTAGVPTIVSDAVPNEAKLADILQFVSLEKSAKEWAEIVLQTQNITRENVSDEIIGAGYDIKTEAKKLENIYLEMIDSGQKPSCKCNSSSI